MRAIRKDRVDFVDIFQDAGVSLRKFLTKRRLLFMYNKV
jgi:hypothetical protein